MLWLVPTHVFPGVQEKGVVQDLAKNREDGVPSSNL